MNHRVEYESTLPLLRVFTQVSGRSRLLCKSAGARLRWFEPNTRHTHENGPGPVTTLVRGRSSLSHSDPPNLVRSESLCRRRVAEPEASGSLRRWSASNLEASDKAAGFRTNTLVLPDRRRNQVLLEQRGQLWRDRNAACRLLLQCLGSRASTGPVWSPRSWPMATVAPVRFNQPHSPFFLAVQIRAP
jgi:hypothetical protein